MTQQNGNASVQTKKPAGEDLSRWENEGGQPSTSATPRNEKKGKKEVVRDAFSAEALQRLLSNVSLDQVRERVEEEVRQRPLAAIGIATALGFVVGGGFRTRSGRKLLKRALAYGLDNLDKMKT